MPRGPVLEVTRALGPLPARAHPWGFKELRPIINDRVSTPETGSCSNTEAETEDQ